ncbi:MAG: hypothetical protein AAF773_00735 [Cyanobacteria bacterium P01_D01_bin.115]
MIDVNTLIVPHIKSTQKAGLYGRDNDRFRITASGNVTNVCYFILRPLSMSDDAIAAGMSNEAIVYECRVTGNDVTDPAISAVLDAKNIFEVSFDKGVTWQRANVDGPIVNNGYQWRIILKL